LIHLQTPTRAHSQAAGFFQNRFPVALPAKTLAILFKNTGLVRKEYWKSVNCHNICLSLSRGIAASRSNQHHCFLRSTRGLGVNATPSSVSTAPAVSVVIASVVGAPFIDECLATVFAQKDAPSFEVIVVDCHGPENVARLSKRFPQARFISVPKRETVPQLRRMGVEQSQGAIIAVIEEHCLAADQWLATMSAAFSPDYVIVGGPVDFRDDGRLRDWITYFIEYNSYLPPWSVGDAFDIGCGNAAYRKEALRSNIGLLSDGYWDVTLHPKLRAEGARFRSVPEMIVYHRGPFDYFYYLRQRYLFSRAFAGARRQNLPAKSRAAYLIAAPAIPFLLLARIASRVFSKKCHTGKFLLSLPLLVPAMTIYVVGEWMGYAFGPGHALMEVE
jgi:glycosyltransferase involved in cell wall biosynthesis